MAVQHDVPVLVVGGGPAGLIASLQLARNGVSCLLAERNLETTKWPKMDITNCRSMEILRRLGVATGIREVGVPQDKSFDVLFSTGLSTGGRLLTKWDLPSPDQWRSHITNTNDGSMPREAYQRCSQAIFEAWLKPRVEAESLIQAHFGLMFQSLDEQDGQVVSSLTDQHGQAHTIKSQYVIACDGAGSRVRQNVGIELIGGPVPEAMYLIHFRSRDLHKLHTQGQFWHIFFTTGHVIISQDEKETWTVHTPIPLDMDIENLNPREMIHRALGAEMAPFEVQIDEILVTSRWRPNICVSAKYISTKGRVFLSGDSAHQNIPTGGYGMNTAVGDSFDVGWKVAAAIKGYGGPHLLQSYEDERRPVAIRNIERSGVHWDVHSTYQQWCARSKGLVNSDSEDGETLRGQIAAHLQTRDNENKDLGLELGYRYNGSPVIISSTYPEEEPLWIEKDYVPSTWPGARAPHVFLADGRTSIFDLFGKGAEFTLVDFSPRGIHIERCEPVFAAWKIPYKLVHLPNEQHVHKVWERDFVIVRPDDHVAWRCSADSSLNYDADKIVSTVVGQTASWPVKQAVNVADDTASGHLKNFTGTIGHVDQNAVKMLAGFQK